MNKTELIERLQDLTDEELTQVLSFVNLLRETPDELTKDEIREVQQGQNEFAQGDCVRFADVRRTDV